MRPISSRTSWLLPEAVAFFALFGQPLLADLNQGLVANWCFDDCAANDCGPNNLDGANSGAACIDSPWGKAFEFRQTDIVRYVPSGWDNSIADAFSIAANVRWDGPDATYSRSNQCLIFDGRSGPMGSPGSGGVFYIGGTISDGRLRFNFNGSPDIISDTPVPAGVWMHVAVVFDGPVDRVRLYLDGQVIKEVTTAVAYRESGESAAIGNNHWDSSGTMAAVLNGAVDELRIYNRVLTQPEIALLAADTCGNSSCDGIENRCNCPLDCGATSCGDGCCGGSETCSSCSADCGLCGPVCGNGPCESGEDCGSCPQDCGSCGGPIPAMSEWGLAVLATLTAVAATLVLRRRSSPRRSPR